MLKSKDNLKNVAGVLIDFLQESVVWIRESGSTCLIVFLTEGFR